MAYVAHLPFSTQGRLPSLYACRHVFMPAVHCVCVLLRRLRNVTTTVFSRHMFASVTRCWGARRLPICLYHVLERGLCTARVRLAPSPYQLQHVLHRKTITQSESLTAHTARRYPPQAAAMDYSLQYDDAVPDTGASSFSFITPYLDAFFTAQVFSSSLARPLDLTRPAT